MPQTWITRTPGNAQTQWLALNLFHLYSLVFLGPRMVRTLIIETLELCRQSSWLNYSYNYTFRQTDNLLPRPMMFFAPLICDCLINRRMY